MLCQFCERKQILSPKKIFRDPAFLQLVAGTVPVGDLYASYAPLAKRHERHSRSHFVLITYAVSWRVLLLLRGWGHYDMDHTYGILRIITGQEKRAGGSNVPPFEFQY